MLPGVQKNQLLIITVHLRIKILIKQMPAVSLIRQGGSVKYTIIFYPTLFGHGPHGLQSAPIDDVTFIQ